MTNESQLLDIRISKTIIEFANALLHRYNQELALLEQHMNQGQNEDEDEPGFDEGMHADIRRCCDILELVDAEVEDR